MYSRISPVDGQQYQIGFEMRLPLDWNGRFLYQGNGGTDGNIAQAVGFGCFLGLQFWTSVVNTSIILA